MYNDFGHSTSDQSEEVTTFGGIPRKAPPVSAFSVNHTSIEVRWEIPSKKSVLSVSHFIKLPSVLLSTVKVNIWIKSHVHCYFAVVLKIWPRGLYEPVEDWSYHKSSSQDRL